MRYYGGRPRYGVGLAHFVLPYAYATSKEVYTRTQFILISLAPLVVLSMIGTLLLPWVPCMLIALASNAAGSMGDLWMTSYVLRFPSDVQLLDERSGLSVYGATRHQGCVTSEASRGREFLVAWLTFAGICFSIALLAFFLMAPLAACLLRAWGVESFALGLPESHLLTYRAQDACVSLQEPGVLLLSGLCGFSGLLFALARMRKQRPESKPAGDQNEGNVTRMCLP